MDLLLLRAHGPSHAEMSGFCEQICVVAFFVMSEVLISQDASQADCLLHVHCIGTIARDIAQRWHPVGAMKPGPLCCRQRLSCKPGGKYVGVTLHISQLVSRKGSQQLGAPKSCSSMVSACLLLGICQDGD